LEYEDVKEAMDYNRRLAKAEGFSDGFEKGMEKGREEALCRTAKNLLELGIPLADVTKATGLNEEQLLLLK
jgi:predicted transposase/invertase (TIGR01784 family)